MVGDRKDDPVAESVIGRPALLRGVEGTTEVREEDLADLARKHRTLVLATHKLREAQLADRLLWVEQGRVVSEALRGTPPFEAALARLRQDG